MKNIRPRHLFISLLAFFFLASFTGPLQKLIVFTEEKINSNNQVLLIPGSNGIPSTSIESLKPFSIDSDRSLSAKNSSTPTNNIDSVSKNTIIEESRIGNGINSIKPLPVKPLPLTADKKLLFDKLPGIDGYSEDEKEYYKYDSVVHTFRKIESIEKSMGFDPVRFRLTSSKESIDLGEELEIKIIAEFLDVSPQLLFQFEGSNAFTLKMLLPEGFVQTGGTYYDFIQGKVDKENPKQEFTIKGFFEAQSNEPCFSLLRSFAGAGVNDVWEKKTNICLSIDRRRPSRNKENSRVKATNIVNPYNNLSSMENLCTSCTLQSPATQGTHVPVELGMLTSDPLMINHGNGYSWGCIDEIGDTKWFYFVAKKNGDIKIKVSVDKNFLDYITFGPFDNISDAQTKSKYNFTNYPCTTISECGGDNLCNYSSGVNLTKDITFRNATIGKIYTICVSHWTASSTYSISAYDKSQICDTPNLSVNPANPIEGNNLTLNGCPNGSNVTWKKGNDIITDVSIVSPGIYTATCTISDCISASTSVEVLSNANTCSAEIPEISVNGLALTASGSCFAIVNNVRSEGKFEWFEWLNDNSQTKLPDETRTITAVLGNTYQVRCYVNTSCENRLSSPATIKCEINTPTIEEPANRIVAVDQTVTLITNYVCNGTLNWYKDDDYSHAVGHGKEISAGLGCYRVQCQVNNACSSFASQPICIRNSTCGDFKLFAYSNATARQCGVSAGEPLILYGGIENGVSYDAIEWKFNDTTILNSNSGAFTVKQNSTVNDSGTYTLRVQKNGVWCETSFTLTVCPCSFSATPLYSFSGTAENGTTTLYSSNNCPTCNHIWTLPTNPVTTRNVSGFTLTGSERINGTFTLSVTHPNGCTSGGSVNVNTLLEPVYSSIITNAFCDNVSGWIKDDNNIGRQISPLTLEYRNITTNSSTVSVSVNVTNYGYFSYPWSLPANNDIYEVKVKDPAGAYIGPYQTNPAVIQCCALALNPNIQPETVCNTASRKGRYVAYLTGHSTTKILQYRLSRKTFSVSGFGNYTPVNTTWTTIPVGTAVPFIQLLDLDRGFYQLEIVEGTVTTNQGCKVLTEFVIDCEPTISVECGKAPLISVIPEGIITEGTGVTPILYAEPVAIKSNTSTGLINAAYLNGNSSIQLGSQDGTQSNTFEAWIKAENGKTITVGYIGSGEIHRSLFRYFASGSGTKFESILSVGSNGITLIENTHISNSSRVAIAINKVMTGWNHVALVYRNHIPELYINGILEGKASQSLYTITGVQPFNTYSAQMGYDKNLGFIGSVDEIRLWFSTLGATTALTSTTLSAYMKSRNNVPAISSEKYWAFENATNKLKNVVNSNFYELKFEGAVTVPTIPVDDDKAPQKQDYIWKWNGDEVGRGANYTMPESAVKATSQTYVLQYTGDNGATCLVQKTIEIKRCINISPKTTQIVCAGTTVTLTATGNPGSSFNWYKVGQTTILASNTPTFVVPGSAEADGIYYAVGSGCGPGDSESDRVTVKHAVTDKADASADPNPVTESFAGNNTTVQLKGRNIGDNAATPTYSWKGPNGFISALQNPKLLNVTKANHAGIYTLTLTQSVNNLSCTSTATVKLMVNSVNCGLSVNADPTCSNGIGTITVTVVGNTAGRVLDYSINNTTWQSSNTFTNLLNGEYNVYVRSRTSGSIDQITEVDICYAPTQQVTVSCVSSIACSVDKKLNYERWFLDASYADNHEIKNFSDPTLQGIFSQLPRESIFTPNAYGNEKDFEIHDDANQNFIARLTGSICPPVSGNYTFYLSADNSALFYITVNGVTTELWAPNRPDDHEYKNASNQIPLVAGQKYPIKVVYRQGISSSFVKLFWQRENFPLQLVSADYLHPASSSSSTTVIPTPECDNFIVVTTPNKIADKIIEGTEIKVIARSQSSNTNNFVWSTDDNTIYNIPKGTTGINSLSVANNTAVYLRPQISAPNIAEEEKTYKVSYSNGTPNCFKEIKLRVIRQTCDCPTNDCDNIEIQNPSLSNDFNNSRNFVAETVYFNETATEGAQTVTYYDGLGRPTQKTNVHAGPEQQDIILPIVYDALGRTDKTYLPYPVLGNNGAIVSNPAGGSTSWYGANKSNSVSYTSTEFEASPLNRVLKQHAISIPDADNSGTLLTQRNEMDYATNIAGDVKKFDVSGLEVTAGFYPEKSLYITKSTEVADGTNGNLVTREYTDKEGRIVCKEVGGLRTYNVYNTLGQLVCVVPPKAIAAIPTTGTDANKFTLFSTTSAPINELVFAYAYNDRGLMSRKKVPSAKEVTMEYYDDGIHKDMLLKTKENRNDLPMETTFIYDDLNRPLSTLVKVNNQPEIMVMSHQYDSYPTGYIKFQSEKFYSATGTLPDIQTDNSKLKGLEVSSWVLATTPDGTYDANKKLVSTIHFDTKNRPVQTITQNYNGGNDITSSDLDFIGRAKAEFMSISLHGLVETKTRNGYDYGGRKTAICQKIDNGAYSEKWQPIAAYSYNDIGEMTQKILGCRTQVVDYQYNIRGYLTKLNNPAELKVTSTKEFDFFGMELRYTGDGNIKKQIYANGQRKYTTNSYEDSYDIEQKTYQYTYGYDLQKRLLTANMSEMPSQTKSFNLTMGAYDDNGNISTLQRSVNGALVDNLDYKYDTGTNLLTRIDEKSGNRYFKDDANYTYYTDGSLKNDDQKEITITYTANTLPAKITGTTNYQYIYDAGGKKLQTKVGSDLYEYAGNAVYLTKGGTTSLEFVGTPEGRWIPKEGLKTYNANKSENSAEAKYGRFEYILKDHLGNSRVACRCLEKPTATTTTDQAYLPVETQTTHYDPWGVNLSQDILPVPLPEPPAQIPSVNLPQNRFTYNGKEYQKDIGLFEYGFRWYDPMIARFTSVDPISDKFSELTVYQYASNNPSLNIDLDGLEGIATTITFGISAGTNGFKVHASTSSSLNFKYAGLGIGFGLTYYSNFYTTEKSGLELRSSALARLGTETNNVQLGTNYWKGFGGVAEFDQQTGMLAVQAGKFKFRYENDGAPFEYFGKALGDLDDKYRTAAASISWGNIALNMNLITGKRTQESFDIENGSFPWHDGVPMGEGPYGEYYTHGFVEEFGPKYRFGGLTLNYNGLSVGINSDRYVRHPFQNYVAHDWIKDQRQFPVMWGGVKSNIQYSSYNSINNIFSGWGN